jgi:hypothetical protein
LASFFKNSPVLQQGDTGQRMLIPPHVSRFISHHHPHPSRNLHAFTHWGPFIARLVSHHDLESPVRNANTSLNFTWIAALMLNDVEFIPDPQLDLKSFLTKWCPGADTFTYHLPDCNSDTGKHGPHSFSCYGVAAVSFLHSKAFVVKDHVQLARLPFDWIAAVPDLYHWYVHNSSALLPDASCPFGPLAAADKVRTYIDPKPAPPGNTFQSPGAAVSGLPHQTPSTVDIAAILQQQHQMMQTLMQTMMATFAQPHSQPIMAPSFPSLGDAGTATPVPTPPPLAPEPPPTIVPTAPLDPGAAI